MKHSTNTLMCALGEQRGLPDLEHIIRTSHERSAQYGVDPHQDGAPEGPRLSQEQLEARIQQEYAFYSLAKAQLDSLYTLLRGTGFCMALADKEGYVLYVVGDTDLLNHFRQRRCTPGYRWTERDIGTCAIGLVLHERVPVFLPGDRMFAAQAQGISNAGAPVFAPDGQNILGVVSLSGRSDKMHVHTLGLVRQSAETVTAQLREQERTRELAIKNEYLSALLESDSRGMVTVDPEGRIVQTNSRAKALLNLSAQPEHKYFETCISEDLNLRQRLQEGKGFRAREILSRRNGTTHFASLDPIRMANGEVVGGLFTILEKKETMRMAVAMTGTCAHFTFDSIVGDSPALAAALHMAHISASNTAPVLLHGETGTGKELFAQAIHNESDRRQHPFVAINCGAIPKELLESELFGYEEGAFTGAMRGGRPGKIELADSGTLFLDEIGDMPFDMQVKLLRVLQSGELQRVGGLRTVPVNLRIISATHKDLKEAITQHKFRADLYYRISTLNISVPPLRDRPQDIAALARHFISRHARILKHPDHSLPEATLRALQAYTWPGNIRQLESTVERAVYMAEGGPLLPQHLALHYDGSSGTDAGHVPPAGMGTERTQPMTETFGAAQTPPSPYPAQPASTWAEAQHCLIRQTLQQCGGNMCAAARQLGISRPTLYRKLRKRGD